MAYVTGSGEPGLLLGHCAVRCAGTQWTERKVQGATDAGDLGRRSWPRTPVGAESTQPPELCAGRAGRGGSACPTHWLLPGTPGPLGTGTNPRGRGGGMWSWTVAWHTWRVPSWACQRFALSVNWNPGPGSPWGPQSGLLSPFLTGPSSCDCSVKTTAPAASDPGAPRREMLWVQPPPRGQP